jgi:hypothetical protein
MLLRSSFFLFIAACLFNIVVTTLHHGGESTNELWKLPGNALSHQGAMRFA